MEAYFLLIIVSSHQALFHQQRAFWGFFENVSLLDPKPNIYNLNEVIRVFNLV